MNRLIQTDFTVVVIGSVYLPLEEFADDLHEKYGINALISSNLPFAKQMVKGIDNAVDDLVFIHLTLPTDDLTRLIAEENDIPMSDAYVVADDANFMEQIIDFDNSTPDDLRIITYTGANGSFEDFVDFCADIIENEYSKKEEAVYDGEKRS